MIQESFTYLELISLKVSCSLVTTLQNLSLVSWNKKQSWSSVKQVFVEHLLYVFYFAKRLCIKMRCGMAPALKIIVFRKVRHKTMRRLFKTLKQMLSWTHSSAKTLVLLTIKTKLNSSPWKVVSRKNIWKKNNI